MALHWQRLSHYSQLVCYWVMVHLVTHPKHWWHFLLWFVNVIIEKFPRQPGNECSLMSLDVKLLTLTVALACLAPVLILLESTTATAVRTSDKRASFAFTCVAVWWVNHPATIPCTILWTLQCWTCSTGTWSSHTSAVWISYWRCYEYGNKTYFNFIISLLLWCAYWMLKQ